jgi:hypothetical protein
MNHDMIAAGHPRLEFEYALYLQALPKHWHEKPRGETNTETGTTTGTKTGTNTASDRALAEWAIGQTVVEQATCELTLDRQQRGAWPELADWKCAACHHSLRSPSVRLEAVANDPIRKNTPLGGPLYNGFQISNRLPGLDRLPFPATATQAGQLKKLLAERLQAPLPGNGTVPESVQTWLAKLESSPSLIYADDDDRRRLVAALLALDGTRPGADQRHQLAKQALRDAVSHEHAPQAFAEAVRQFVKLMRSDFSAKTE